VATGKKSLLATLALAVYGKSFLLLRFLLLLTSWSSLVAVAVVLTGVVAAVLVVTELRLALLVAVGALSQHLILQYLQTTQSQLAQVRPFLLSALIQYSQRLPLMVAATEVSVVEQTAAFQRNLEALVVVVAPRLLLA